jgi:phage-related protein
VPPTRCSGWRRPPWQSSTLFAASGPAWTAARLDIQQSLLDGIGASITALGVHALPSLRQGLSGIAGQLNLGAKAFLSFAASGTTATEFGGLFANIRDSIGKLVPAVAPASKALLDLASVGASFGPQLSAGLAGFVENISGAISKAAADGSLKDFLQGALDVLRQLGTIAGNLGGILGAVFGPASQAGSILLTLIGDITGHLSSLLNSASGKSALGGFFTAATDAAASLVPAINAILDQVGPVLRSLSPAIAALGSALGGALKAAAPAIAPLAKAIAAIVIALTPLLPLFGEMIGQILPPLANLVTTVARAFAPLISALAGALAPILPVIANAINALSAALGPVITQLVSALSPILPLIADAFGQLITALTPIFPALAKILTALIPLIPPIAKLMVQFSQLAVALLPAVIAIFKLVPPVLRVLVPVITTVVDALSAIIGAVKSVLSWITNLVTHIGSLPGKIAGIAGDLYDAGGKMMKQLFEGIKNALADAGSFALDLGKTIVNGIIGAIDDFLHLPLKVPRITIFNPIPGADDFHIGGQTIIPRIPKLALGATIQPRDGGTLAILAEAGKAESVVDTGLLNRQLRLSTQALARMSQTPGGRGDLHQHIHGAPGQDTSTLAHDVARRWEALSA